MPEHHVDALLITAVERQSKHPHRFNIFINGEYSFSAHEDIVVKHRLLKGRSLNEQDILTLTGEDERQKAYHDALRFIGRKPRSTQDVLQLLKRKGYEDEIALHCIQRLMDGKLLDDLQYARHWSEQRMMYQKKGRKWVKQELLHKGVAKENIEQALEGMDPEEEYRIALELGERRWKQTSGEMKQRLQKIGMFLLRRGYSNEITRSVMQQLRSREDEGEGE